MEYALVFMVLAICFGLYMTWGVGANDVANAMGTSVGSGAITVKKAILIAAVFEFAGAVIAGGHVTGTIRKGIIDPAFVPSPEVLVWGMLSALLAAGPLVDGSQLVRLAGVDDAHYRRRAGRLRHRRARAWRRLPGARSAASSPAGWCRRSSAAPSPLF